MPSKLGVAGAAAAVSLAAGALAADRPPAKDLVEVEVLGVRPLEDGESHMLVLGTKDASAALPLVIGRAEATAIQIRLLEAKPPRPLTHDLLGAAIRTLGAKVLRVEIDGLEHGTFLATIRLSQGGKALSLDARPSDSVALALRVGAPILAARKVLTQGGLDRKAIEELRRRGREQVPSVPRQEGPAGSSLSL